MNKTELAALFALTQTHNMKMVFPNVYTDLGEVDCLHITDSGYAYFYEVKASKADFKNDLKKKRHKRLLRKDSTIRFKPKYFIYVLVGFTVEPEEIPPYAGCYILDKSGLQRWNGKTLKPPPTLFNERIDPQQLNYIYKKMTHRYLDKQLKIGRKAYNSILYDTPIRSKRKGRRGLTTLLEELE